MLFIAVTEKEEEEKKQQHKCQYRLNIFQRILVTLIHFFFRFFLFFSFNFKCEQKLVLTFPF